MDVSKFDALDDFERQLAAEKAEREKEQSSSKKEHKHRHRSHRSRSDRKGDEDDRHSHRHKRSRTSRDDDRHSTHDEHRRKRRDERSEASIDESPDSSTIATSEGPRRDDWMKAPIQTDIDYDHHDSRDEQRTAISTSSRTLDHDDDTREIKSDLQAAAEAATPLDQTALNKLKAQMMKAKLMKKPEAARLSAEYDKAAAQFANTKPPDVIVLGHMESRLLAGTRGEVKAVDNKRGRERGTVEENEDMSIEDMVREERRTRNQAGGESKRFAERIAKDGKFDDDLEYMDDNASKLAKRVHKSEINLKNSSIAEFQKMNRVLDNCQLCHHEDTNQPPIAPIVSLATRVYLTLPTEPELADGGAVIVPIQHRVNLLECDDDEWEEIRNFMKSLTRMYHDQGRSVIFYENAAAPNRHLHAAMNVVPLPYSLGETAPAFFRESILSTAEEWTQHKKLIDTLKMAKSGGGRGTFRRALAKEMPYFHVWFELDGGLGHVVEDEGRWPKGDLFAREIIGGMLDSDASVIKKQGRWNRGGDARMEGFKKRWRKFDWTRVLMDGV